MDREGYLRRYFEYSRTTRFRLRKTTRYGAVSESSSDDDDNYRAGYHQDDEVNERFGMGASENDLSDSVSCGIESSSVSSEEREGPRQHSSSDVVLSIVSEDAASESSYTDERSSSNVDDQFSDSTDSCYSHNRSGVDNEGLDSNAEINSEIGHVNNAAENNGISDSNTSNYDSHGDTNGSDGDASEMSYSEDEEDNFSDVEDHEWGGEENGDEDLYEGAPLTLGESMIAILTFVLQYRLSYSCLSDLLKLIALHCRNQGNRCKKTLYHFRKFFQNLKFPLNRHHFCLSCFSPLATKNDICRECGRNRGVGFFVEIPILSQLKALYKRKGFTEKLLHRFTRRKRNEANFEDIYDGCIYRALSEDGNILSDPANISLTWYTDGIPIFSSSKYQLWPFYLVINELPYNQRTSLPNALLAGVWFGSTKPIPNMFLDPICTDLLHLREGINVQCADRNGNMTVKGIVICGTCDLPAKAKFLNIKQHNARYGCPKCKIETTNLRRGLSVYPFLENLELRTEAETLQHAEEALNLPLLADGSRQDVFGVKGPTVIAAFVYKHIRTTAVDIMHCVFLGIVKQLLGLWFGTQFSGENFSLTRYVRILNERLSAITPPSFVKRLPRTLADFKYWKAYELKMFLLYYSIPLLQDIMNPIYLDHHKLLVYGVYLLTQSSISEEMVNLASELLSEYVSQFENLYGLEHMTCNVHQLLHFPDTVRDFGPLWVTSCFPFEDLNGKLKNLINGPRYAELQVHSSVSMLLKLSELRESLHEGAISHFCNGVLDKTSKLKVTIISDSMGIIGAYRKVNHIQPIVRQALEGSNINGENVYEFHRLLKSNIVYGSGSYERAIKTNSSCVKYVSSNNYECIGFVHSYIRVTECECIDFCDQCDPKYFAVVKKCVTSLDFSAWPGADLKFLHRYIGQEDVEAVELRFLLSVCFVVKVADKDITYLVETVNLKEAE